VVHLHCLFLFRSVFRVFQSLFYRYLVLLNQNHISLLPSRKQASEGGREGSIEQSTKSIFFEGMIWIFFFLTLGEQKDDSIQEGDFSS